MIDEGNTLSVWALREERLKGPREELEMVHLNEASFYLPGYQRCPWGPVKRWHPDSAGENVDGKCGESCRLFCEMLTSISVA